MSVEKYMLKATRKVAPRCNEAAAERRYGIAGHVKRD
jgi:hypothetical protein